MNRNTRSGFTLIELLVVISIISLLSSVIFASLHGAQEKARIAGGVSGEANILHGIGDQLVGEWKFNDGAGKVLDTSSWKNNGFVYGSTAYSANGSYDGSGVYKFTPGNSTLFICNSPFGHSCSNAGVLNVGKAGTNFTISAWVNYNTTSSSDSTIFFEGDSSNGFGGGGSNIDFQISNDNLSLSFYDQANLGSVKLSHNRWTFVAVSFNATSRQMSFYVDGQFDKTITDPANPGRPTFSGFNCAQIGARYCASYFTPDFNGMIDNVRVYSATITADAIKNIYAEEAPKFQTAMK